MESQTQIGPAQTQVAFAESRPIFWHKAAKHCCGKGHGKLSVYLSMILGTNFSSESGPEIPLNVSLLLRFGGHVTTKKGATDFLLTKKGATCGMSLPLLAPTESPKRFPNRPLYSKLRTAHSTQGWNKDTLVL